MVGVRGSVAAASAGRWAVSGITAHRAAFMEWFSIPHSSRAASHRSTEPLLKGTRSGYAWPFIGPDFRSGVDPAVSRVFPITNLRRFGFRSGAQRNRRRRVLPKLI